MRAFGRAWADPEMEHCEVPIGGECAWCCEGFEPTDQGVLTPFHPEEDGDTGPRHTMRPIDVAYHRECFLRSLFGSVAHQDRQCSCYGGEEPEDAEGALSRRESARLAVAHYYAQRGMAVP